MIRYFNYNNIFLAKNIVKFSKYIRIKDYIIKLKKDKQPFFELIYSLKPVKLEILKIYIEIHFVNSFIRLFKFLIKIFVFFNQKLDKSFHFCMNYQDFNNLIIKNQYLLLLMSKLLD